MNGFERKDRLVLVVSYTVVYSSPRMKPRPLRFARSELQYSAWGCEGDLRHIDVRLDERE